MKVCCGINLDMVLLIKLIHHEQRLSGRYEWKFVCNDRIAFMRLLLLNFIGDRTWGACSSFVARPYYYTISSLRAMRV